MLALLLKCGLGAAVVLIISILSKSKAFYIAGLVPLFPTFALIAHVIVSQQQGVQALRTMALFGLWAIVPYAIYWFMGDCCLCHLFVDGLCTGTQNVDGVMFKFSHAVLGRGRSRTDLWLANVSALNFAAIKMLT